MAPKKEADPIQENSTRSCPASFGALFLCPILGYYDPNEEDNPRWRSGTSR